MAVPMEIKDFQIGEKVYEDIMGGVYVAKRVDPEDLVCLKILHEYFSTQYDIVQAFHRCAELYCSVENEHCIRAHGHGDESDKHYIVLEHFNLFPLEHILSKKRVLSVVDAIEIIEKLASIIRFNHIEGNIHGQLTPQNILVDDNLTQVKITDFGFEEFIRLLVKKKYPPVINLLPYYSPEFIAGVVHLDRRSDIFSLGVLFYRLLSGKVPWSGGNLQQDAEQGRQASIIPPSLQRLEIPDVLDQIILDALEPKVENRCSNLSILLDNLSRAKSSLVAPQPPTGSSAEQSAKLLPPSQKQQDFDLSGKSQKQGSPQKQDVSGTPLRHRSVWTALKIILVPFVVLFSVYLLISFTFDADLTTRIASLKESAFFRRISNLKHSITIKRPETPGDLVKKSAEQEIVDQSDFEDVAASRKKKPFSPAEKSEHNFKNDRIDAHDTKIASDLNSAAGNSGNLTKKAVATRLTPPKTPGTQAKSQFTRTQEPTPMITQTRLPRSFVDLEVWVRSGRVPQQAEIYMDGASYGKTNSQGLLKISKLRLRKPYLIKVQKYGFEMWAKEITFTEPGIKKLNVELRSLPSINSTRSGSSNLTLKPGTLTILLSNPQSLDKAFLYVNGKLWEGSKNTVPLRIELPPGIYNVEVKKQGFRPEPPAYTLELAEEEDKTLYFYLVPQ